MSFKKIKVVMLPTNEKANMALIGVGNRVKLFEHPKAEYELSKTIQPQHLYFLSDEEIKVGDWGISKLNEIVQFKKNYESTLYKKIIATTDNSLEKICEYKNGTWLRLPQPSQSFIEKFVEEYNEGNVITEVMVEYNEPITEIPKPYKPYSEVEHLDSTLKVSKDNTITIRKVKESWSTEEMRQKLNDYRMYAKNSNLSIEMFDKWIEENL